MVSKEDSYSLSVTKELEHLLGGVEDLVGEEEAMVGSTQDRAWLIKLAGRAWVSGGMVEQAVKGVELKWRRGSRSWSPGGYNGLKRSDSSEINLMMGHGVLRRATPAEAGIGPPLGAFSVPKGDGARRMILDARPVNDATWPMGHTTMPSLKLLTEAGLELTEAFCVDVSKAYWSLPVMETDQPALSFMWEGVRLLMTRMAMGLQVAAGIFQRLMEQILTPLLWRFPLIKVIIFQDDVGMFKPKNMAAKEWEEAKILLICLLQAAGLKVANKKTQEGRLVTHLGFVLDLQKQEIRMSPQKLKDIRSMILRGHQQGLTIRTAMVLLGKLGAGALVDPLNTLELREVKRHVWAQWAKHGASRRLKGGGWVLKEAEQRLSALRSGRAKLSTKLRATTVEMQTDASRTGGGLVWWELEVASGLWSPRRHVDSWQWTDLERALPIATLEALAVLRAVVSVPWRPSTQTNRALVWVDNRTVVATLRKWHGGGQSMAPVLKAIFMWLELWDVVLDVRWIPSSLNILADMGSRGATPTEMWQTWEIIRADPLAWSRLVAAKAKRAWRPSTSWELDQEEVEEVLEHFSVDQVHTEVFGPLPWETARFPHAAQHGRMLDWDRALHLEGVELLRSEPLRTNGVSWVFPALHLVPTVVETLLQRVGMEGPLRQFLMLLPVDLNKFPSVTQLEGLAVEGRILRLGRRLLNSSNMKRSFPISVFLI